MHFHKNGESTSARKDGQEPLNSDSDWKIPDSQNTGSANGENAKNEIPFVYKTPGIFVSDYKVVNDIYDKQTDETIPENDCGENSPDQEDDAEWKHFFASLETAPLWERIKKIKVAIVSFVSNIVSFFRDRNRLKKLQEDQNRIAVSIKGKRKNGDYQIVNCIYDRAKVELVDPEEDAVLITGKQLDAETKKAFGNKDMIVLQ